MIGMGIGLRMGARGGGWTPAKLFAGGEDGAWYGVHPDYVYQDAAATTPAGVGDPVGHLVDRSGNGNHATQSTASARPVLRQSGSLYYLEFDGVDDFLETALVDLTGTDKVDVFAGVYKPSDAAGVSAIVSNGDIGTVNQSFAMYAPHNSTSRKWAWSVTGDGSQNFRAADTLAAPVAAVMSGLFNVNGANVPTRAVARLNGAEVSATDTIGSTAANFRNDTIRLGVQKGTSDYLGGSIYSLIVRGAQSSAVEIASAEAYVAAKTGVSL